ncbi:MAG: hypothetical protein LEGION0398_MBIBDBAK_01143 [Legionellaceae bacterium]
MDEKDNLVNWQVFWEQTREMFDKGEAPDAKFYETLTKQASARGVSYDEFYYLLSRFPSLVIRNIEGNSIHKEPIIIKSRSNWDIQDYGDVIATSAGRFLWGSYTDGTPDNPKLHQSTGTLTQQFIDTAYDVMVLAKKKEWIGIHLIHGFYGMVRAAWIASTELELDFNGFYPSSSDYVILSWVNNLLDKRQKEAKKRLADISLKADKSTT